MAWAKTYIQARLNGRLSKKVVGFVDTLFVAKLGLVEVTAVGIANAVLAVYLAIFMALGVGTLSLIARNIGSGNMERAKAVAKQSTFVYFFSAFCLVLCWVVVRRPYASVYYTAAWCAINFFLQGEKKRTTT